MALAAPSSAVPSGSTNPRVAPPLPAKTWRDELVAAAETAGITLRPWQRKTAHYLMARNGKTWRYPHVAVVVGRQNGKTELLVPRILWGLHHGRRILHTAQNRTFPRKIFLRVATIIESDYPELLQRDIRYANGQEEIVFTNGASYTIIAPQRGARGMTADDLIIDELREYEDYDFINAAQPTLATSPDQQTIYLSNAGTDKSVVLNDLRNAADDDEHLAYLEWSADPELDIGDERGWAQANPSLGVDPSLYRNLRMSYERMLKGQVPRSFFETEHLCRWVTSMSSALVTELTWRQCLTAELEPPKRPGLGVALDPSGTRVSAYLGWQQSDGSIAVQPVLEIEGSVDVDEVGKQLRQLAMRNRARMTAYSGSTDVALAQYLSHTKAIDGRLWAQASANFATLAESGRLRVITSEKLDEDLRYTVRRDHHDGAWSAVRADESRPITSALAAIRAAWLAAAPKPAAPRIG